LTEAERALRSAKEHGDVDAEMRASREMMSLQVSLASTKAAKQPEVPPERPKLSDAMQRWLDDGADEWFNKDDAMTTASVGFDRAARRAGFAPESKEYFDFINDRMRKAFPENFETDEPEHDDEPAPAEKPARPVVAAAPARRAVTPGQAAPSRTVRLSAEEMEVAKALGLSPQQYAANKAAK
jgi:hypothetical protein